MDVSTFYALFSATCFTLVGLWWNVVQGHAEWMRDPALRRVVGGIYLSFLLPALMGLFAQVGGTEQPQVWRAAFTALAVVGCVCTLRLLARARGDRFVTWQQGGAALLYVLIAVVGAFPGLAPHLGLRPIQAAALGLIALILLGHALVWRFMAGEGRAAEEVATGY
jgi:cytochrome bd-type quinol oxidase subunit 2